MRHHDVYFAEALLESQDARRVNLIYRLLLAEQPLKLSELGSSRGSILKDIEEMNQTEDLFHIQKKGSRYIIEGIENQDIDNLMVHMLKKSRAVKILQYLMFNRSAEYSIQDISEKLYLSEATIYRIIQRLNDFLEGMNITIQTSPLTICGDEFAICHFYTSLGLYIMRNADQQYISPERFQLVVKVQEAVAAFFRATKSYQDSYQVDYRAIYLILLRFRKMRSETTNRVQWEEVPADLQAKFKLLADKLPDTIAGIPLTMDFLLEAFGDYLCGELLLNEVVPEESLKNQPVKLAQWEACENFIVELMDEFHFMPTFRLHEFQVIFYNFISLSKVFLFGWHVQMDLFAQELEKRNPEIFGRIDDLMDKHFQRYAPTRKLFSKTKLTLLYLLCNYSTDFYQLFTPQYEMLRVLHIYDTLYQGNSLMEQMIKKQYAALELESVSYHDFIGQPDKKTYLAPYDVVLSSAAMFKDLKETYTIYPISVFPLGYELKNIQEAFKAASCKKVSK